MLRWGIAAVVVLGATGFSCAADPIADPASPVGRVGKVIVDAAGGRSYDAAYATSKSDYNPYGIDQAALLAAAAATAISTDGTGNEVKRGELSIQPQFNTPWGKFSPTADTPPTIPFAFFIDGVCQSGYVSGFPAPATTYAVDLKGAPCSAGTVDDLNFAAYKALENDPRNIDDAGLEAAVRAAYTAAAAHALANGNYFARDGAFGTLRDAVAAELGKSAALAPVIVPVATAESLEAARKCLATPGTELRIAVNAYGDGISLVAVTSRRVFSFHYDPHETAAIVVAAAADCGR